MRDLILINATKARTPRVPFKAIKSAILGKRFLLELVFVTPKESRQLNRTHRKKDKPTNVLSFTLKKGMGSIIIAPAVARAQHRSYGLPYTKFIGMLFIHGLLHLKGHTHGSTMEGKEKRIGAKFLHV